MKTRDLARRLGSRSNFERLLSSDLGRRYMAQAEAEAEPKASAPQYAAVQTKLQAALLDEIRAYELPSVSKREVAQLAHAASQEYPQDYGLRRAAVTTKRVWEGDREGHYTASQLDEIRARLVREFPKSAVWGLFDSAIPELAFRDLNKGWLDKIASGIKSQEDYDFAIEFHGLEGNDVMSQKSRNYILAQLNAPMGQEQACLEHGLPNCKDCDWDISAQSPEEGLSPEDLGPEMGPPGMFDGMQPEQVQPPVMETMKKWQPQMPMEQEGQGPPDDSDDRPKCYNGACFCGSEDCQYNPAFSPLHNTDDDPWQNFTFGPNDPNYRRGPKKGAQDFHSAAKEESKWWTEFKAKQAEEAADEAPKKATREQLRWAMSKSADEFEPSINEQQDDAFDLDEPGEPKGEVKEMETKNANAGCPPTSMGSSEKPSEPEFKTDVPEQPNQTEQSTGPKLSESDAHVKATAKKVTAASCDTCGRPARSSDLQSVPTGFQDIPGTAVKSAFKVCQRCASNPAHIEEVKQNMQRGLEQGFEFRTYSKTAEVESDEDLAEGVEDMVNDHMKDNAEEELEEGHKPWAAKISRSKVEDLLLDGQTIQAAGYAIRIAEKNGKDQIEIVGKDIPPMVWPMRALTAGINTFAELVETAGLEPGKINQQQPDAVKPEELGTDSSVKDVKSMEPGSYKQKHPGQDQAGTSKPSPKMPSNDNEGFQEPAVKVKQPHQPGTDAPDTDIGRHSSDDEGFETPRLSAKRASVKNALRNR